MGRPGRPGSANGPQREARDVQITAYDIDPARAASLAADGVKPAGSIGEAAAGADLLVLMVATRARPRPCSTVTMPAAPALAAGAVVMVMATVGPAPVQRWAQRLAEQGVELVDAPVSGEWPRGRRRPAHHGERLGGRGAARTPAARRDGPQRSGGGVATR